MRTTLSLTVSHRSLCTPWQPCMPPSNHVCPLATMHAPSLPPTMHTPQNHACSATMYAPHTATHAPHNHAHPPATMHAPQQPCMPPTTTHAPLTTTHAPLPSNHTCHPPTMHAPPTTHAPRQPCTHPLWTEWHTHVKILPCPKLRLRAVNRV